MWAIISRRKFFGAVTSVMEDIDSILVLACFADDNR